MWLLTCGTLWLVVATGRWIVTLTLEEPSTLYSSLSPPIPLILIDTIIFPTSTGEERTRKPRDLSRWPHCQWQSLTPDLQLSQLQLCRWRGRSGKTVLHSSSWSAQSATTIVLTHHCWFAGEWGPEPATHCNLAGGLSGSSSTQSRHGSSCRKEKRDRPYVSWGLVPDTMLSAFYHCVFLSVYFLLESDYKLKIVRIVQRTPYTQFSCY
jgi:hypothetical protein